MPEVWKEIPHGLGAGHEAGDIDLAVAGIEVQGTDKLAANDHCAVVELLEGQGAADAAGDGLYSGVARALCNALSS